MKRILIIDDDDIIVSIYRHKLEHEGYLVEVASDGSEGLNVLRITRPDAILLDLNMPKMSGLELLKKILKVRQMVEIPVVVLTASKKPDQAKTALDAGATRVLSKSWDNPYQVIEAIKSLVRIH